MKQTYSYREKLILFIKIFLPVFATQMSLEAIPFFGTVIAGQSSPQDLVGVAIGSSIWVPVFVGLCGILNAIIPIVSNHFGANRQDRIAPTIVQGLYLALILAVLVIIVGFLIVPLMLAHLNLEPKAHLAALGYLQYISFGVPLLFLFTVLRCFMDSMGKTKLTMFVTLTVIPVNGFFNWLLINGNLGIPAFGGAGAGAAASITYLFLLSFAILAILTTSDFKKFPIFTTWIKPSIKAFKEQLSIGIPLGLSIFLEVSIFSVVTLLMSEYSTLVMAGHQSALNFSGVLYMLPLSISISLTILVGYENGGKRYEDAKKYGEIGLTIAIIIGVLLTTFIQFSADSIGSFYSKDPDTKVHIVAFLFYAQFFFLVDAIAAPIQGILRGYKDVRVTFWLAIFSYWVVGVPVGYTLANFTDLHAFGYWIGLISGLTAGAIGLTIRLRSVQQKLKSI